MKPLNQDFPDYLTALILTNFTVENESWLQIFEEIQFAEVITLPLRNLTILSLGKER